MKYCYCDSPVGALLLAGSADALQLIAFPEGKGRREPQAGWEMDRRVFTDAIAQLQQYFAGTRRQFSLTLAPAGTTFQLAVWHALQEIPYAETRSYRDIAQCIGKPAAMRAVGAANGRNPLPIVVPCHRVIGADGSLTGFGGGIACKQFLLRLEAEHAGLFATM